MIVGATVASILVAATLAGQALASDVVLPPSFAAAAAALKDVCLPVVENQTQIEALLASEGFVIDRDPPEFIRHLNNYNNAVYKRVAPDEAIYLTVIPSSTSAAVACAITLAGSSPVFMDSLRQRFAGPHPRYVEDAGNSQPKLMVSLQAINEDSGRVEKIVAAAGADPKSGLIRTTAMVLRVDPPSNEAEMDDIRRKCSTGEFSLPLLCGGRK